jgi:hypothetical protein
MSRVRRCVSTDALQPSRVRMSSNRVWPKQSSRRTRGVHQSPVRSVALAIGQGESSNRVRLKVGHRRRDTHRPVVGRAAKCPYPLRTDEIALVHGPDQ